MRERLLSGRPHLGLCSPQLCVPSRPVLKHRAPCPPRASAPAVSDTWNALPTPSPSDSLSLSPHSSPGPRERTHLEPCAGRTPALSVLPPSLCSMSVPLGVLVLQAPGQPESLPSCVPGVAHSSECQFTPKEPGIELSRLSRWHNTEAAEAARGAPLVSIVVLRRAEGSQHRGGGW